MYNNSNWKWVIFKQDSLEPNDFLYLAEYRLKDIKSFYLNSLPNYLNTWTINLNSKAKIQRWVITRLGLTHTNHKGIIFKRGELEAFLDELDLMMEILYGKT